MFTNDPRDWGSISGQVIPKTLKILLDTSLLYTQHFKVRMKGRQSNPEKRAAIEKGAFKSPLTRVRILTYA